MAGCYFHSKHKAYQPLTAYWAEADLIVHSEFRDGNVPAGYQQRTERWHLPEGVGKVMLRYCAEGRDERFGVIDFAVGVDVTSEFTRAVSEVEDDQWCTLYRKVGECRVDTGQQWAEVNFVPEWTPGHPLKAHQAAPDHVRWGIWEQTRS